MSQPARASTQNPYAAPPKSKFGGLAWSALILGIVGVCRSILPNLNHATAAVHFAGPI